LIENPKYRHVDVYGLTLWAFTKPIKRVLKPYSEIILKNVL
jgi:hypothetical protein